MDKIRFEELQKDSHVVKINAEGVAYFVNEVNDKVISFLFTNGKTPEIKVIPVASFLKEMPTISIGLEVMILVNADAYLYAASYRLTIDNEANYVLVSVADYPELGMQSSFNKEENRLTVSF